MSFELTSLLLWTLSGLYHPNRHDQIIPVEGAEMIRHAEDRTGAELEGRLVDHTENTGQAFARRGGFLDLQWEELPIPFKSHVDLLGVPVTVEIEIRLQSRVLVALHNLRHGEVFEQRAVHRAALSYFRRRPSGQIANEASVIEIHFRRLDRAFQHIVGIGMQQEDDTQRFQDIDLGFCSRHVDICILRQRVIIQELGAACSNGCDETVEL